MGHIFDNIWAIFYKIWATFYAKHSVTLQVDPLWTVRPEARANVTLDTCGLSHKVSTIVIYDSSSVSKHYFHILEL